MVEFWVAGLIALVSVFTNVLAAAIDRDELIDSKNESITFLRLCFIGFFGALMAQGLAELKVLWWLVSLTALVLSILVLVVGQLLAKRLADTSIAKSLARRGERVIRSLDLVFTPLSASSAEQADEFEQELLESVDEFGETITREVMVPRTDMATVESSDSLDQTVSEFLSTGFSRLPVVGKNIDDIVGVLYLKDVMRVVTSNPELASSLTAANRARPATFVPESKPVDDLLREMQKSATHIAIVIDEYGGVAGLVTMEDVIEEIVGDISDEYDRDLPDVIELGDGRLSVSAKFSLFDLGELFDIELDDEDVDSVGGLISKQLGRLATKGDSVTVAGLTLTPERFEGRPKRLKRVIVEPSQELLEAKQAFGEAQE